MGNFCCCCCCDDWRIGAQQDIFHLCMRVHNTHITPTIGYRSEETHQKNASRYVPGENVILYLYFVYNLMKWWTVLLASATGHWPMQFYILFQNSPNNSNFVFWMHFQQFFNFIYFSNDGMEYSICIKII